MNGHADKSIRARNHIVTLDNRERSVFSGVHDVESFNDEQVVLLTEAGAIILTGKDLHISRLNLEEGELIVEGYVYSLEYDDTEAGGRKGGLFSRFLK